MKPRSERESAIFLRARKLQKEIDDAFGIRPAINVISNEKEVGVGIFALHPADEGFERAAHPVNVSNDPAHGVGF